MAFAQCKYCDNLFNNYGSKKVCPECDKKLDEAFVQVRNYIYKHPGTTDFSVLAEGTGVEEKAISFLIEDGRLQFGGKYSGHCRVCGKPADESGLCPMCKTSFTSEVSKLQKPEPKSEPDTLKRVRGKEVFHHVKKD